MVDLNRSLKSWAQSHDNETSKNIYFPEDKLAGWSRLMEMETFRHSAEPESVLLLQQHFRFRWLQNGAHTPRALACVRLFAGWRTASCQVHKAAPAGSCSWTPYLDDDRPRNAHEGETGEFHLCEFSFFFVSHFSVSTIFFHFWSPKGFRKGYNDGVEWTQGERCVSNCDDLFFLRITFFGRTHSQYIVVPSNSVANVVAVVEGRIRHGAFTFDAGQV